MPSDEVTMVAARDFLGDLVDKARLLGTRTILSKNGKRAAAIVSMEDYERLTAA
jgi:prevent-host-death family protein